ncbi:hypothetical protein B0H11DRAFT_301183 [Mycena galericulata]|nr:hypothetical protein B0H11DRAFT_301183 [Mycena galericulata]
MNAPRLGLVTPIGPLQVQESRTERLKRQQARFRDRGGIFVPRAHNNLLDILLGKKKPSPLKRRSRSRSASASPSKKPQKSKRGPSIGRKSGGISSKSSVQLRASMAPSDDVQGHDDPEQPIAGPSRVEPATSKKAASRKGKKTVAADDDDTTAARKTTPAKRKGRIPKSQQTIEDDLEFTQTTAKRRRTTKAVPEDPAVHGSDAAIPAEAPRKRAVKGKAAHKRVKPTPDDDAAASGSKSKEKSVNTGSWNHDNESEGQSEIEATACKSVRRGCR